MFTGIVETESPILSVELSDAQILRVQIARPPCFDDLKIGDSIAVEGVCLTLEDFTESTMRFAIALETLQVTGWTSESLNGKLVNLERSLRYGDRVHGHLVTGHVDCKGQVIEVQEVGGAVLISIGLPKDTLKYIWKKGSCSINGVSLTVNSVENHVLGVCLIPETVSRTSLKHLRAGDEVNIETDWMAKGLVNRGQIEAQI